MANLLSQPSIHLDHNATAPLHPAARDAIVAAIAQPLGNPSSVHAAGQVARGLVERARRQVAAAIGARAGEIVLTSGASESNVMAWRGVLLPRLRDRGRATVWYSAAEHPSLRALANSLAAEGVVAHEIAVDRQGRLQCDDLGAALAAGQVDLVSVVAVGSELGSRYPIAALAALAHRHGALLHTDAAQAWGRVAVDVTEWHADLVSLSGHKIGGPMGTGALWVRRGVRLSATQPGHQEQGLRAGTENVIGFAGMGAAAACLPDRLAAYAAVRELRDRLWHRLSEGPDAATLPPLLRWGDVSPDDETGHVLTLGWHGIAAATLVMALDLAGVAASAGSACSSGTTEPSALLRAMAGREDAARAGEAVRFSLGPGLDAAAIDDAAARICSTVARLCRPRSVRLDPVAEPHYAAGASP